MPTRGDNQDNVYTYNNTIVRLILTELIAVHAYKGELKNIEPMVGGSLRVLRLPPPLILVAMI
jgi:hypothetical protein